MTAYFEWKGTDEKTNFKRKYNRKERALITSLSVVNEKSTEARKPK